MFSLKIKNANKNVNKGAKLIIIATIVSLKYLTDAKLTKAEKLPAITLVIKAGI